MSSPLFVPVPEAARSLGIGRSSFYVLLKSGRLTPIKIGRRTVIAESDLRRLAGELFAEARAAGGAR